MTKGPFGNFGFKLVPTKFQRLNLKWYDFKLRQDQNLCRCSAAIRNFAQRDISLFCPFFRSPLYAIIIIHAPPCQTNWRKGESCSSQDPAAFCEEISQNMRERHVRKPKAPPKQAKWSSADDATLIQVLTDQQAAGNQADNSWKRCVWQAACTELAGSELHSGGAPKTASKCHTRWDKVNIFYLVYIYCVNYLAAQIGVPCCQTSSRGVRLVLGWCAEDGSYHRRNLGQSYCGMYF